MWKVVFRSKCCKGGTVLWTVGLEEDVKDSIPNAIFDVLLKDSYILM